MPIVGFIFAVLMLLTVIYFVLKKIFVGYTNDALNKLNAATKRNEKMHKELEEKTKDCEAACQKKIEASKEDAQKIVKDARAKADEEVKDMLARAKAQAEETVQKGSDAKEKIKNDIIKDIGLKTIEFAGRVYRETMEKNISEKFNEFLCEAFVKELPNMETKYIGDDVKDVEIISRYSLSDALKKKIVDVINEKLKRKMQVTEKIEENILAGIILKFGTLALDGSLSNKIKEAAENMKKEMET